jgi:hypothetical protein
MEETRECDVRYLRVSGSDVYGCGRGAGEWDGEWGMGDGGLDGG